MTQNTTMTLETARVVMETATRDLLAWMRRTGWHDHDSDLVPADINTGRCVDWAEQVCLAVPGTVMTEWDDPASQLLHTFVYWPRTGKYYDAERPDGTTDVTGLPVFHRFPGTQTGPGYVRNTADILAEYWDG